jgi:hypothetical protein
MSQDALTRAARGKDCTVRLPCCNGNPETVVLAHYRLLPFCGTGTRPPSWMGAWACSACHDAIDSRAFLHDHSRDRVRLAFAEGVLRTQAKLFAMGLLIIKGKP